MLTSITAYLKHAGVEYALMLWSTAKGGVQERRGDAWIIVLMNATANDVIDFMAEKGVAREVLQPLAASLPKA
jgi:hypothetical protein